MDLPAEIAVMTLPNAILFPQAMLPLYIFEPRYRQMLADALHSHRMFSIALRKPGRSREVPSRVAGLGLIRVSVRNKDGSSHLILQGLTRLQLSETVQYKPYRVQRCRPIATVGSDTVAVDALSAKVLELAGERLEHTQQSPAPFLNQFQSPPDSKTNAMGVATLKELVEYLSQVHDPERLADLVSCTLLADPLQRQVILETANLEKRLKALVQFLLAENARLKNNQGA